MGCRRKFRKIPQIVAKVTELSEESDLCHHQKYREKVKVYLTTRYNSTSVYNWVQQVYYLEPGKDTKIEVTGTSIVGTSEP